MATAASTKGAARRRSASPRVMRANSGKSAMPKTRTTFPRLGPRTPTMAITKSRYGRLSWTSQSRMATSSTQPRR